MPPTTVPAPSDSFNFAQHLLALNAGRAAKAAFVDDLGTLNYGTLDERVRRIATGWESELTIAVDDAIARRALFDLMEAFYAEKADDGSPPPTRLKLRVEVLAGTWEALLHGQADLAIGVPAQLQSSHVHCEPGGELDQREVVGGIADPRLKAEELAGQVALADLYQLKGALDVGLAL